MANIGGNFVNPAYASPEQITALREYAKQLLTEQPVQHWAQGVGNIARALVGGYEARQADTQEQASKQLQAKMLMEGLHDWQTTKDPAKLLAAISGPQASPTQAYILKELLQPGPPKSITSEGITAPTPPTGLGGGFGITGLTPTSVRTTTEPVGRPPPTAAPTPVPPERLTNLTGPDRSVTGVQVTNVPPGLNPGDVKTMDWLQARKAEYDAERVRQQKRAEQEVKAEGTAEVVGDIRKNLQSDIPDAIGYLDKNPTSSVGKVAWMGANVPGTVANTFSEKLKKIEAAALQHEIQTIENAEQRMVKPQEAEAMRVRLGLNQSQSYPELRWNLMQLQKRFSDQPTQPSRQGPTDLTPQPGQAQAEESRSTSGFKILKVSPPGQ